MHPAQPQYAPPAPTPKKKNWTKIILLSVVGMVILCGGGAVACTALFAKAATDVSEELNAEQTDVTVTSCTVENSEFISTIKVGYKVTNSGDRKRTYLPSFAADAENGDRLGEGADLVADLEPGQAYTGTASILLDKAYTGKATCKLK